MFSFKVAFANFYQHCVGFYKFASIDVLIEANFAIKLLLAKLRLSSSLVKADQLSFSKFRKAVDTPPASLSGVIVLTVQMTCFDIIMN